MLEGLQFIFSSFWVWFGTVVLIAAIGNAIARIMRGITRSEE